MSFRARAVRSLRGIGEEPSSRVANKQEIPMKSRKLFAVMALLMGAATTAQAGDWDDRWYFAPWLGANHNDGARDTDDFSLLVGAGIGKYVAPNTTVDVFVDRVSRHRDAPYTSNWSNTMFGVAVRYYFGDEAGWQPYI